VKEGGTSKGTKEPDVDANHIRRQVYSREIKNAPHEIDTKRMDKNDEAQMSFLDRINNINSIKYEEEDLGGIYKVGNNSKEIFYREKSEY